MPRAISIWPDFRWARWSAAPSCPRPATMKAGDVVIGVASSGVHSNGYSLVRKVVEKSGLSWDAAAPFAPGKSLGEALLTPTRLYVKSAPGRDPHRRRQRAWRISPAAASPKTCRAPCPTVWMPKSIWAPGRRRRCSAGWRNRPASPSAKCCAPSIAASAWWRWWRKNRRPCHRRLPGKRRQGDADRHAGGRRRRGQGRLSRGAEALKVRTAVLISGRGSNLAALIGGKGRLSLRDRAGDFQCRRRGRA